MNRLYIFSTCVVALVLIAVSFEQVSAQATNSARLQSPSPSPISDVDPDVAAVENDELDEQVKASMLERVRNAASRDQVRGALHDLLTQKGGYIGEITRISEDALTVRTRTGSVIIPLTERVRVLKNYQPLAVDAIAVGNWATVLGSRDVASVTPEYVLISEASLLPKNQVVVVGSIYELSAREITITTRDTQQERSFSIATTSVFQDQDGSEASWRDFEADYAVLIVAVESETTEDSFIISTVRSLADLGELQEATNE